MSVVSAFAQTSLSGTVSLQGLTAGNLAQPVVFTLTPTGTNTSGLITQTLTLAPADGAFTLTRVPAGTYTLGIKGGQWLRKNTPVDTTGGNVSGLSVSLLAGDINGDNQVDTADLAVLQKAYGSSPASSNWDPRTDLNGDGNINLADFFILRSNNGKIGDPPPPAFRILGINNGDTISGDVSVAVNAYSETGLLIFAVDGVNIGTHNITANSKPNTADFSLETAAYSNGTHILTVSDPYGNTDTRTVAFSNALSNVNYNPMFDNTAGVTDIANTCHITGAFSTPQAWTVSITDDSNNPIKSFSGSGASVNVTWDGTNANGQSVPGDDYLVTITGSRTSTQAVSGTGLSPQAVSTASKTFLVNKDNYADSIILLDPNTFGTYGQYGDSPAVHLSKAIAFKHFLHAELDRYVGSDFNYPILVSIIGDNDFKHDPKLVSRINNKFRRPSLFVYVAAHGDYHDPRSFFAGIQLYSLTPVVHPFFTLGSYNWYSAFSSGQKTTFQDIDVSALTAGAGYDRTDNGPLVWIDTCFSTAGGNKNSPDYQSSGDSLYGFNPVDYQWATDFGIDYYGDGGGIYFGSITVVPDQYIQPDRLGSDWSYWRQNFLDFICAGENNFQTALRRSYDIQSFTSQPTPPEAMVSRGYGYFAF